MIEIKCSGSGGLHGVVMVRRPACSNMHSVSQWNQSKELCGNRELCFTMKLKQMIKIKSADVSGKDDPPEKTNCRSRRDAHPSIFFPKTRDRFTACDVPNSF
ncbi:hypothetical protein L1987_15509 [Smallanthus sonchifolius]|uniref:Uncharacterized protein n=1 Tax=Smallanthus sonchifolius TaxID=185202 RepID=A0ACB9J6S2_9ASTR|nr:hypothetical protein L1987_15509 [Smallanthus sonchifolius]